MNILGLSGGYGHDAAACLVSDGQLITMVEEERLVRIKRAPNMTPIAAALYCLSRAGLAIDDLDCIAVSWLPDHDPTAKNAKSILQAFVENDAFRGHTIPKVEVVNHHLSHALGASYGSGFDQASVLVLDGHGEGVSATAGVLHHGQLSLDHYRLGVEKSLGHFYSCISRYLGLGGSGEGKLMGLAAYGEPRYDFPMIHLTNEGYEIEIEEIWNQPTLERYFRSRRFWERWLEETFGAPPAPTYWYEASQGKIHRRLDYGQVYQDLAASAQHILERVILHLVKQLVSRTGYRDLILSGGVALNCSVNSALLDSGLIDRLYIFPATHDAGGCLGAALSVSPQDARTRPAQIRSAAWGPAFDDATIEKMLKQTGIRATYVENIADLSADMLARGYIIGWFQGALEIGPRALGQRSILANPTIAPVYDRLNKQIKNREPWRPFAPSILTESTATYLGRHTDSPFMLLTSMVAEQYRQTVPAIVHVDGTTRPQTVDQATNPLYWQLIKAFEARTGVPLILNTSFNLDGEPIVCTPFDALRTFYTCPLDALAMGNFLLTKTGIQI